MIRLQPSRWKMGKFFTGSAVGPISEGADRAKAYQVARLLDRPSRLPVTPIEIRLDSMLRQAGTITVAKLVKKVAADLYLDELNAGAGVLDIGLFGDRLFDRDVLRELKAGDGVLWEIKSQREET